MYVLEIVVMIIILFLILLSQVLKHIGSKRKKEKTLNEKIDNFFEKNYKIIWLIFIVILFITVIYKFGTYPNYIGVDEAGMAYDAYCISNYGVDRYLNSYPLYLTNFGSGQSVLCAYITVFFIKIFGANIISYRMPTLLIYLLGVIASYFLVKDSKNKKNALLFTFLIITCPWNIVNARQALDCNLYGGMLMIDLFLMNRAKKNYQYILAGISVGITLYTYCLTWITMPIFLAVWSLYMLYIKKIKFKELVIFAIPIIIFAIPLIYFLLLNYGIVDSGKLGIFTVPILPDFRGGQISISNIFTLTADNLQTIFLAENTIYLTYIPLFIIGYIASIIKTIKNTEKKIYSLNTVMTIAFTTIFIGLMLVNIPTANKANALYIPILYFVIVGLEYVFKNSKILLIIVILLITILFINFEYNYYTKYAIGIGKTEDSTGYISWYNDRTLTQLISKLETDEDVNNAQKHILPYRISPYIYEVLYDKLSPYEFIKISSNKINTMNLSAIYKVGNYNYYIYAINLDEFTNKNFKDEDCVIIVSKQFIKMATKFEAEYKKYKYEDLYIFVNKNSKLNIDKVL